MCHDQQKRLEKEEKNKCFTFNEMLYCFKASQTEVCKTFDYQVGFPVIISGKYPL